MHSRNLSLILSSAIAIGLVAGCSKKEPAAGSAVSAATPTAAADGQKSYTDTQVLETMGWLLGSDMGLAELGMTDAQFANWSRGFRAAVQGNDPPYDIDKILPSVTALMTRLSSAYHEKALTENRAASAQYFAKLKNTRGVVELPSGLRYELLEPGTGATPKATDTVRVDYEGRFVDGKVFDSSFERGTPAEFSLADGVIPAWTEGLQHVRKGGKIRLHVPANLAYGDDGRLGIPPGAALVFDITLIDIVSNSPAPAKK